MRSEYQPTNPTASVAGWLGIHPGSTHVNNFIQVGITSSFNRTSWFVSLDPNFNNTGVPQILCLRGIPSWYDINNRAHGCLGNSGDLGIGLQNWGRFQLVTYGDGKWIARVRNNATNQVADVAFIYNSNTTLASAEVTMEEWWSGLGGNPWVNGGFYSNDLKYRTGSYWAHWPSNIGSNYGNATIGTVSNSGSQICPDHYRVQSYVQGNPYLWYLGVAGSNPLCSGILYTGGGPNTRVTSIVGETASKLVSSENGQACVRTNRSMDGSWEQWQDVNLGGNVTAYRGNNAGMYLTRRSNNELWSEAPNSSNNDAKFQLIWVSSPYTFRLRNLGNNLYVNHYWGSGCTRADTSGTVSDTIFRYVAP